MMCPAIEPLDNHWQHDWIKSDQKTTFSAQKRIKRMIIVAAC